MLRKVLAAAAAGTSKPLKPAQKSDHHLPLPPPPSPSSSSPSSTFPPPHILLGLGILPPTIPPTSVLESSSSRSSFPATKNQFFPGNLSRSAAVGAAAIGIAEALGGGDDDSGLAKTGNGVVLFRSKLRASSPIEFGIKTKNPSPPPPLPVARRLLSSREMELSEEYTCVISHGTNPTTTHIFDGCVVDSFVGGGGDGFSIPAKVGAFHAGESPAPDVEGCCDRLNSFYPSG